MPLTLADYARYGSNPYPSPRPFFGRWQRLLCRLGVHHWHRAYHEWQENQPIHRFIKNVDLLSTPMQKIDGQTYRYRVEEVPPGVEWRSASEAD